MSGEWLPTRSTNVPASVLVSSWQPALADSMTPTHTSVALVGSVARR